MCPDEHLAASSLENCSRTDSSIKQLPKYLGQGWESSCTWAGAVCGVKGSPSKCEIFRFWAIGFLVLPGKTYFWSLFVEYFLQVNLEVLAVLRIMKPLTFLFQILTFKTKKHLVIPHNIQERKNMERLVQLWVCSIPKLHHRRIKGSVRSWFLLLLHCFLVLTSNLCQSDSVPESMVHEAAHLTFFFLKLHIF